MSLSKLFQRIIWHNNTTPAINEDNLNAMSKAIDDIDDRVILIGDDVVTVIPQIQAYLEQAESIVEAVEELSQNPPYIGANGNWYVFDTTLEAYKDSGVDASITVDIADITMIAEGAQPYVTNTGTSTDPVFHLFLPRSPQGATGNGIANIAKTSTQGLVDTYTITMTDGTTYTFTVTNGQNGGGSGDMLQSDYDSDSTVKNAGGIADYVEGKVAPMLNVLGAKNLLPNVTKMQTVNGITTTLNSDGSVTINGTATGWEQDNILKGLLKKGTYKISIGTSFPSGVFGTLRNDDTNTTILNLGNGSDITEKEFTLSTDTNIRLYNGVGQGVTVSNLTFYPMIRLASIEDDTYAPYAMTNQQITHYVQAVSNPNLLDNPWFTVNQRGITSFTDVGGGYSVDRWMHDSDATGSISNGVYTCNVPTYQQWEDDRLVPLLGKVVTLSWLLSDGTIGSETKTLPSTLTSSFVWPFTNSYVVMALHSSNQSQVARISSDISIKAVKLELGTVSTLAQDTAPNYATELLKCQRYFYRMNTGGGIFQRIGIARASTATAVEPQVKLPTTMRKNPSVTVVGNITAFNIIGNGSAVAASSYSGTRFYGDYKKILFSAASNLVVNELYSIEVASTAETDTTYIDFSADL